MPKYCIAFKTSEGPFLHHVVETDTPEIALRFFFNEYAPTSNYTKDEEGFSYFREDFSDSDNPQGSIIPI